MAVDQVGSIVLTTAYFGVNNQVQMCDVFYACASTSGGGSTIQNLSAQVTAMWAAWKTSALNTASTYLGLTVRQVGLAGSSAGWLPNAPLTQTSGVTGSQTVGQTPTQARPLISWQTAFVGRAYRGRNYLPSPDASMLTATTGLPTVAFQSINLTLAAALYAGGGLTAVNGGTTSLWQLVLVKRPKKIKPVPASPPYYTTWTLNSIINYTSPLLLGTQRRSGSYGRPNPFRT